MANAIKIEAIGRVWASENAEDLPECWIPANSSREFRSFVMVRNSVPDAELRISNRAGSLLVEAKDQPSYVFFPHGHNQLRQNWAISFGANPDLSSFQVFGQDPDFGSPKMTVHYLGHPDRDLISPLMVKQEQQYDPDREFILPKMDEEEPFEKLVILGPVLEQAVSGIEGDDSATPKINFVAKTMFYTKLSLIPRTNLLMDIQLSVATVADKDGLWRIAQNKHPLTCERADVGSLASALAEISVFFRHERSLHEGVFPLQLLGGLRGYLTEVMTAARSGRTIASSASSIFDSNQFVWEEIKGQLPDEEMKYQAQRLVEALHSTFDLR